MHMGFKKLLQSLTFPPEVYMNLVPRSVLDMNTAHQICLTLLGTQQNCTSLTLFTDGELHMMFFGGDVYVGK